MFSGLGPLRSNRENVPHLFSCCSKESNECEEVFVPNVDYFGDSYRARSNPKKREEEPFRSVRQESL